MPSKHYTVLRVHRSAVTALRLEQERRGLHSPNEALCAILGIERPRRQSGPATAMAKLLGISTQRVHQLRQPQKHKARRAVGNAVRLGKLTRPTSCERCGKTRDKIEGHHDDYFKPLDVVWLCYPCHLEEHSAE